MREEQTLPEMPEPVGYVQWKAPDGWISSSVPTKLYFTANQLRAYGLACFNAGIAEGGKDAERLPERTPMDRFENAIREVGVVAACEWFGHSYDSDFTKETTRVLAERAAMPNKDQK